MAGAVGRGEKLGSWILVKNASDEVRDIKVVYSWNTLKLLAADLEEKVLVTNDWFMKLRRADAILPARLEPGEHLEFPTYEVTFATEPTVKAPSVRVTAETDSIKLSFNLKLVLGSNPGIDDIETGAVEVQIDDAPDR